jgi:signal transduction histidine kinase
MVRNWIRSRLVLSYVASFLLLGSVALRSFLRYYSTPFRWLLIGLLLAYTALFLFEIPFSKRSGRFLYLYFVLQISIILTLLLYIPPFDYFIVLFIPLVLQALWFLPRRAAFQWIGLFLLLTCAGLIIGFGWLEGLSFALSYTAMFVFVTFVCLMTLQAEQAQAESQSLLAELRSAHRKLQVYAQQVEELAGVQERERLARELHDSVTQTIFSMTLTAQAARILLERDPARVAAQLENLQNLSQSALAEMRSLIQQLHSSPIVEEGLAAALRRHVSERQQKDGLNVDLQISGERRLPSETEAALFRVVQEALNNVIKHAQTERASVVLSMDKDPISLLIEDHGKGFDPATVQSWPEQAGSASHLGLSGMAERVKALGGRLIVDSEPGKGTSIRVEDIRLEEAEHA